jgi:hypothetical protein
MSQNFVLYSVMILQLPRDVIWIILKQHLQDTYNFMCNNTKYKFPSFHEQHFIVSRFWKKHEMTFDPSHSDHKGLTHYFFTEFIYPLRFVCRQFDNILRAKIVKKQYTSTSSYIIILV